MKKFIKLIPAALALVALASCSQDDLFNQENNQQAVDGKTMVATIEGAQDITRAAFAENKNDAGKADKRTLVWTAGDSYKVYGELASADKYTLQNASAGKASGKFDLMTEDYNTEPAFAVFPYDDVEADRASKKLTVKLNEWTYGTADVKDEGYNQGGFKSVVPMYGQIAEDGNVAFGYMTAILRVDLQKLPKKMTRLIVVTDRPLKGTFEAEFDPADKTAYPEIVSPVSNDDAKADYTFDVDRNGDAVIDGSDDYLDMYFLSVNTESVNQRTNKTFFIPVPTGNKYKTFDVLIEYNMGNLKKYEIVAQLGALDYPKVLKWERGKVKSLSKEVTVTSGGNTPAQLAAFLKAEWKSFPADADINITVTDAAGDLAAIDLDNTNPDDIIFEVPAEVKGRTINIIVDPSVGDAYINGTDMTIIDEDPAPVASEPLRLINICAETANNTVLTLNCPETQVQLSAPTAATYGVPAKVLVAEEEGLVIEKEVTVGDLTVTGGEVINKGTTGFFYNKGDNNMKITGTSANVKNLGKGALIIEGTTTAKATITGYIYNGNGTDAADKLTIKNAILSGAQIRNFAKADAGIEIENVDQFKLADDGKGAVSIKDVTVKVDDSTVNFASEVKINNAKAVGTITYDGKGDFELDGVSKGGGAGVTELDITNADAGTLTVKNVEAGGLNKVTYNGKKAVTFDNIKGGSTTGFNIKNNGNAADFSFTNIKGGTIADVKYAGTGNVTGTGVKDGGVYPTITTMTTGQNNKAGDVTLTDLTIGTSFAKASNGTLTINGVHATFGTITNAKGAINLTGNAALSGGESFNIASLTQNGAGKITLNALNALTALTINESNDLDYKNAFITTVTVAGGKTVNGYGTKCSGIKNQVAGAGKFIPTTDVWDGSSKSFQATDEIYTSGSFAKLADAAGAVNQWVEIDLGGNQFNGIATGVTSYTGLHWQGAPVNNFVSGGTVKNLKATSGMFKTPAAALTVNNLTLDAPTITAKQAAGAVIGKATKNVTLVGVTVTKGNIGTTSNGAGTDQGIGGMIGEIDGASAVITLNNGNVNNTTITGHYYMGGIIGKVTNASKIYLYGQALNVKNDLVGTTTTALTFVPKTQDGSWSTLLSGTIAPFIGGIVNLVNNLQIYGTCDEVTKTEMEAWNWDKNFLTANETIKFKGCKRNDLNFIGYTATSCPIFQYDLKLVSGFEANPVMTRRNTSATTTVLDTEYNCYMTY